MMRIGKGILTGLLILLINGQIIFSASKDNYGCIEVQEIISVYDGDTFKCNIAGYPAIIGKNIGVRIAGVDTPEMNDKRQEIKAKAIKARAFVVDRLNNAKKIELRNMRRDKYFRILAEVYVDGENLSDSLIKNGLAKAYFGGRKK
jgi:endonuclease YncB( thermonuclease family)